jgi:hypothetical protein
MKNDIETAKDHLLSYQRTLDDGLIGFRYSHEEAKMLVAYADQFIPKWISVEDGLPEEGEKVLCYCSYGVLNSIYERGEFYNNKQSNFGDRAVHSYFTEITHWMPLPNSPTRLDEAAQNKTSKNI